VKLEFEVITTGNSRNFIFRNGQKVNTSSNKGLSCDKEQLHPIGHLFKKEKESKDDSISLHPLLSESSVLEFNKQDEGGKEKDE